MLFVVGFALIALAALFSGLNLGLMSLNVYELQRKAALGDSSARKVLKVRARGNLLLVTLLTGNVAVISALSIVLDSVYHGLVAGLLTTVLITIFGEILPQAILARYALRLGSQFVGIVQVIMVILYPVCAPIAWALDKLLGDELPTVYSKSELKQILSDHGHHKNSEIDGDEVRIARGALSFGDRRIKEVMTPRDKTKLLDANLLLSPDAIYDLKRAGFSRLPVYLGKPDNVVGVLYLKDLIGSAAVGQTAGNMARPRVYFVKENDMLDNTLNAFLKTRNHLFIVRDEGIKVKGIITIEDVLEEIIDREIADEFDLHDDMRQVPRRARRKVGTAAR